MLQPSCQATAGFLHHGWLRGKEVQGTHSGLDQGGKEEEVKVRDIINQLNQHDPDADIVLKERDGRNENLHRQIRVYLWNDRVQIDGYDPEQ